MKNSSFKVLFRMPNWLGDAVMATPLLAEVKKKWPDAQIHVICQKNLASLFIGNPYVDQLLSFVKSPKEVLKEVKQNRYDWGILTTNSFSSAFWFWKGKIKKRVGFKNEWRSFFLNRALNFPKMRGKEHLVDTYKALLLPLNVENTFEQPQLFVTPQEVSRAKEILKENGVDALSKLIGFNATAAFGPAKCWLEERFRKVAEKLLENPSNTLLFFGDKGGLNEVNRVAANLGPRAINLAGKTTLRELIALLSLCNAFLTNDSGPMHLGAALKTPLVALFGSTNAVATGPYRWGQVIHKHVECSPCYLRTCPIDFRCMKRIEVEEVYEALEKLLQHK